MYNNSFTVFMVSVSIWNSLKDSVWSHWHFFHLALRMCCQNWGLISVSLHRISESSPIQQQLISIPISITKSLPLFLRSWNYHPTWINILSVWVSEVCQAKRQGYLYLCCSCNLHRRAGLLSTSHVTGTRANWKARFKLPDQPPDLIG